MSNFILPFNLCFITLMGNFLVGLVIWPQEILGNENINFSKLDMVINFLIPGHNFRVTAIEEYSEEKKEKKKILSS